MNATVPTIQRFEDIQAWQTARELTGRVYALTSEGGFGRDYALRDQLRRAAISIMSNIAEGFEIGMPAQFIRFLGYAKGSAGEVRAQLYVALDVGYLSPTEAAELLDLADKSSRQLSRLMQYLRNRPASQALHEDSADYD